jgi:hypothetical protein
MVSRHVKPATRIKQTLGIRGIRGKYNETSLSEKLIAAVPLYNLGRLIGICSFCEEGSLDTPPSVKATA